MENFNQRVGKLSDHLSKLKPYAKEWMNDPEANRLMSEFQEAMKFDIAQFFDNKNRVKPIDEFPQGWEEFASYAEVDNGHGDSSKQLHFFKKQESIDALLEYAELFLKQRK